MDAFGWSTQPATAAPSCPIGDALLGAFRGGSSFEELHWGVGTVSSDAYHGGLDLPWCQSDQSVLLCQDGYAPSNLFLDSEGFLPAITGTHDRFELVPYEPAHAAGSNAAFSVYSTTTYGGGGGKVSYGESNTYSGGGHETEVPSMPCAVSRWPQQITQVVPPPTKRNKMPDKHTAPAVSLTGRVEIRERWGTNRAAAPTARITFGNSGGRHRCEPGTEAIPQMKEMIYRAAAMRPLPSLTDAAAGEPSSKPRGRKNVQISSEPQTVVARLRREKVRDRLRALQRLVPGGSKMDTASLLDETASYLKFLKSEVAALGNLGWGGACDGDDDRYAGRNFNHLSSGSGGSTILAFGRDGVAGYVKPSRNLNVQL